MSSFLQEVAQTICEEERSIEDYIFILPSKRAGNFLKTTLAQEMGKTIFAPKVYSIEEFIQEIAEQESASRITLLFTLYESYLDIVSEDPEPYESFVTWGSTLLQDIMEIDRHLVTPERVFSYLSAIQEMNHWAVVKEKTPQISKHLKFWEMLLPIYKSFTAKLRKMQTGHQGLLYKLATQGLQEYLDHTAGKKHIFAGFNALNTAESQIIETILTEGDAEIYWDTDPYFLDDPIHDAGYFMRQYLKKWPYYKTHTPRGPKANFLKEKKIQIVGIPKQVSQAKYVGSILRSLQPTPGADLNKTALILGDETLLNPILNALPASIGKMNITMGFPLGQTVAATLLLQWLDLFINKDQKGWYHKSFLDLLTNPTLQKVLNRENENRTNSLRAAVVKSNATYVTYAMLQKYCSKGNDTLEILFAEKPNPLQFLEDALALMSIVRSMKTTGISQISIQAYVQLEEVIQEVITAIQGFPYVKNLKSLKGLLMETMSAKSIDFVGDPSSGLQIMGMLEGRNLDFQTVIITSVNEGILPAGKTVNSLIPYDLKRELDLPTYKEKDAVYTYHFYRILQRAQNIILCYNTEPDVLEGGEMSRLIHQLTVDPSLKPYISHTIAAPKVPLKTSGLVRIAKDTFVMEKIGELAERGFSPTALSDYIRDPITFFKRHLLGIEDPEAVEETLEARTFGILIHECLETLYKPFIGSVLSPEGLQDQRKKIRPLVKSLMKQHYPAQAGIQGKNLIAFEVIVKYLERFMDSEIAESKDHEIRIIALESKMRCPYPMPGLEGNVYLKGMVDRIDQYDGTLRILDYKTGSVKASEVEIVDWESLIKAKEQHKAFQLLCYALLYDRAHKLDQIQAGIISIKRLKDGAITFATKDKRTSRIKDPWITPQVIQTFEKQLSALIKEICDPAIAFEAKKP